MLVVGWVLLAGAAVARADDHVVFGPPGPDEPDTVLLGAGLGFPGLAGPGGEAIVEVAVRPVRNVPVRIHGLAAKGSFDRENWGHGTYWQARGGAEVAACGDTGLFCFVADVDAGVLHATGWDQVVTSTGTMRVGPYDRYGLLLAGRAGFDVGNRHVRFRLVLDLARAVTGPFLVHDAWADPVELNAPSALQAELVAAF